MITRPDSYRKANILKPRYEAGKVAFLVQRLLDMDPTKTYPSLSRSPEGICYYALGGYSVHPTLVDKLKKNPSFAFMGCFRDAGQSETSMLLKGC